MRLPSSFAPLAIVMVGATCAVLSGSPARANLVINGSFEDPFLTTGAQFSSIPGWTATNGVEVAVSIAWAQSGRQFVEMDVQSNTSMSQTISVLPGLASTLTFYSSPRPGQPASTTGLDVKLDGNTIFSFAQNGSSLTSPNWTLYTYTYTPSTSSANLVFTGAGSSDGFGAYLDNVRYTQVSGSSTQVPGPLPLMGAGVAFGLSRKLRRRITAASLR